MDAHEKSSASLSGALGGAASREPSTLQTPQMSNLSWVGKESPGKEKAYSDPEPNPYNKAVEYLESHHIVELFQVCVSLFVLYIILVHKLYVLFEEYLITQNPL